MEPTRVDSQLRRAVPRPTVPRGSLRDANDVAHRSAYRVPDEQPHRIPLEVASVAVAVVISTDRIALGVAASDALRHDTLRVRRNCHVVRVGTAQ